MKRGQIWWASLPEPQDSGPGYRRPVLVVQANPFNDSPINTVIVAAITSNTELAEAPGNILLKRSDSRLRTVSVVIVSQLLTVDKSFLTKKVATLSPRRLAQINEGLRLVLSL